MSSLDEAEETESRFPKEKSFLGFKSVQPTKIPWEAELLKAENSGPNTGSFNYLSDWFNWSSLPQPQPTLDSKQICQRYIDNKQQLDQISKWTQLFPALEFNMTRFLHDSNCASDIFIVTLTAECDLDEHMRRVSALEVHSHIPKIVCKIDRQYRRIKAYAVRLDLGGIFEIASSTDVESITQDRLGALTAVESVQGSPAVTSTHTLVSEYRTNIPWGLQRVTSSKPLPRFLDPLTLNYFVRKTPVPRHPNPVDVYVIDSGVRVEHSEFGGRAEWGAVFAGEKEDKLGHGTHIAATIAGNRHGIAANARIRAVKTVDLIRGVQASRLIDDLSAFAWILDEVEVSKRTSVINFSIVYSPPCSELDKFAALATQYGVSVCAAAGNGVWDHHLGRLCGVNAGFCSPGHLPQVITVAASNTDDEICDFSNYGTAVNIVAPGDKVMSAGIASDVAIAENSGTSFSTAHVTGVVANILSYRSFSPRQTSRLIQYMGTKGRLMNLLEGTPNNFLFDGCPITWKHYTYLVGCELYDAVTSLHRGYKRYEGAVKLLLVSVAIMCVSWIAFSEIQSGGVACKPNDLHGQERQDL